jgi:hypothetical protein
MSPYSERTVAGACSAALSDRRRVVDAEHRRTQSVGGERGELAGPPRSTARSIESGSIIATRSWNA